MNSIFFNEESNYVVLNLPIIVRMHFISKEGNVALKFFRGSMTWYPLKISVTRPPTSHPPQPPPQCSPASAVPAKLCLVCQKSGNSLSYMTNKI